MPDLILDWPAETSLSVSGNLVVGALRIRTFEFREALTNCFGFHLIIACTNSCEPDGDRAVRPIFICKDIAHR